MGCDEPDFARTFGSGSGCRLYVVHLRSIGHSVGAKGVGCSWRDRGPGAPGEEWRPPVGWFHISSIPRGLARPVLNHANADLPGCSAAAHRYLGCAPSAKSCLRPLWPRRAPLKGRFVPVTSLIESDGSRCAVTGAQTNFPSTRPDPPIGDDRRTLRFRPDVAPSRHDL